jgi:hypothetical protein
MLPFLPGKHDPLAVPLFRMATAVAFAGLLIVPFAAVGVFRARPVEGMPRGLAVATLVAVFFVWIIVSLVATGSSGWSFGAITFVAGGVAIWNSRHRMTSRAGSFFLLIVPLASVALWLTFVPRAVEFSRSRAIENSAPLIADIERYRGTHSRYPLSTQALWPDYLTGVIGVERYHYEPSGDAYNILFEQPTYQLGLNEIVVYNPRDEQNASSHAADRLTRSPDLLRNGGGSFRVLTAREPHWKYFWFD